LNKIKKSSKQFKPRKYEIIWRSLKINRNVKVKTHPALFERVRKAVKKERDKDIAFAIANAEDPCRILVKFDRAAGVMTLKLEQQG
jgi:hypothetical protein